MSTQDQSTQDRNDKIRKSVPLFRSPEGSNVQAFVDMVGSLRLAPAAQDQAVPLLR